MTIEKISILVLSDIHFGKHAVSADFALSQNHPKHEISNAVPMKENLISVIKERRINFLFVPGDITSKGSPSEFIKCVETIEEISKNLQINKKNIYYAFGNHDVNWKISKLIEENEDFKDRGYLDIAGSIGNFFIKNNNAISKGPIPGSGVYEQGNLVIFILNSGYFCNHEQKYPHGFVGNDQLSWFERIVRNYREVNRWKILLLHHHPFKYKYPHPVEDISDLQEGAELLDAIGKSHIDFVCHGHRHHPMIHSEMKNGWKKPITFFCAGSLAVNELGRWKGQIPNMFHILNLEFKDRKNHVARGFIESFRYSIAEGWVHANYSDTVRLESKLYFGDISTETEIEEKVIGFFKDNVEKFPDKKIINLPKYDCIPYPLKCMAYNKLNNLLKKLALEKFNVSIHGNYPKEKVVLVRENN